MSAKVSQTTLDELDECSCKLEEYERISREYQQMLGKARAALRLMRRSIQKYGAKMPRSVQEEIAQSIAAAEEFKATRAKLDAISAELRSLMPPDLPAIM